MVHLNTGRLLKLGVVCTFIVGVMAFGLFGNRGRALAQEGEQQTFMVHAGGAVLGNVEALMFTPTILQVHRGDTVMWHIDGFHNVHLGDAAAEMFLMSEVDGQQTLVLNPVVAFPTIEDGAMYQGGDAATSPPLEAPVLTFSLVMDVEPGRYQYFCDIHPGMTGVIEVVADDVEIPTPTEASAQGLQELTEQIALGAAAVPALSSASTTATDGVLQVMLGSGDTGRTYVALFGPSTGVIHAGESVTWTNPAGSIEPHFINSSPYDPVAVPEIVPLMQEAGPPILLVGPGFAGTTESGTTISMGDTFNSPFILPGESFTLTFSDPGTYLYNCHIHPGMNGVIVVEPAA
jgi:plastocyanin